jgi:antitoxin HicB
MIAAEQLMSRRPQGLCGDSRPRLSAPSAPRRGPVRRRPLTTPRTRTRTASNPVRKARYHYNIMLRPEPEGGYTALVPALPGCVTYGRTVDEAREVAKDAISGYIASLRKHNDPVPTDDKTLAASLDLEYSP